MLQDPCPTSMHRLCLSCPDIRQTTGDATAGFEMMETRRPPGGYAVRIQRVLAGDYEPDCRGGGSTSSGCQPCSAECTTVVPRSRADEPVLVRRVHGKARSSCS